MKSKKEKVKDFLWELGCKLYNFITDICECIINLFLTSEGIAVLLALTGFILALLSALNVI